MTDPLVAAQRELDAARDRQRRSLMGPVLQISDDQLDGLAAVSEVYLPQALALWKAANPGPLSTLLEAEPRERDD